MVTRWIDRELLEKIARELKVILGKNKTQVVDVTLNPANEGTLIFILATGEVLAVDVVLGDMGMLRFRIIGSKEVFLISMEELFGRNKARTKSS